jgi:hypothetical protein
MNKLQAASYELGNPTMTELMERLEYKMLIREQSIGAPQKFKPTFSRFFNNENFKRKK